MESLKNQIVKMNLSGKIEKGLLFLLNLVGDNYSEEEKVVGTWIDGKSIYRKVFIFEKVIDLGKNQLIKEDIVDMNIENVIKTNHSNWY